MFTSPVPLSPERHGGKRLQPASSFAFARSLAAVPLVGAELGKAATEFPVAMTRTGETYGLVAVLGLRLDLNGFVDGTGRWLAEYVPAFLRSYPFLLGHVEEPRTTVLCIDEGCGLLHDRDGIALFEASGEPGELVRSTVDFINKVEASRHETAGACAGLARHDLLVPWEFMVETADGPQRINDLLRVDEARLSALSDEAFLALRRTGALALAYGQLFSVNKLPLVERLTRQAAMQHQQGEAPPGPAEIDFSTLNFDFGS